MTAQTRSRARTGAPRTTARELPITSSKVRLRITARTGARVRRN